MKKKKILHIVESFGGGVFSFIVDLVNSIDKDCDITIAYGIREETPENFEEYFSNEVSFIKIENFTRKINLSEDYKAFKEIRKVIKEIKPDIVHLHSSKAGFIGRFAINGRKTKVIYNPHGFSFLKLDDSKLKRFIYKFLEKVATFRKSIIVGCSEGEYKEALKLTKNSICINNGIGIENIKSNVKKINLKNITICTSGRITYQKNPELFNKIAESFPNLKFVWIGDGDFKSKLTSENIMISGWKTREEGLNILNENNIFILPSLWEGLPITLLEAMYMKKICIVSNVVGNRDVIENEINGFIANDLNDYINIINNIIDNKYDLEKITNNAHIEIIENYDIKKMCGEYMKLYDISKM